MRTHAFAVLGLCLAGPAQDPIPVPDGSTRDAVVELAATVRPSARQLAWQATGCNAFVHFGINTFTDREWGEGDEDPAAFAPTDLDAAQWAETFRTAGMQGVVLTCKHHDGFCLWPTATTARSVAGSPFRSGKGDVVREVAEACRAAGLRFGVYLSPWDRSQQTFGTKAYQAIFEQQLRELCTGYGPLFEIWFDGAHCPADDPDVFDWQAVFRLARTLQPDAVLAITGPDVRWVGNEAGVTRADEWSTLPLPAPAPGPFEQDRRSWRALWQLREQNQAPDLGSRDRLATAKALCWWPAETDVSIRPGWFWHAAEDARVKPLGTLLDYWYGAVGGNAVLLLNVPPDRRGRIAEPDAMVLRDLGRVLDATFAADLASRGEPKRYAKVGEVVFAQPVTVDVFDLAEDVAAAGQRVERFRIEVLQNGGWRECARGTTIGFRRILRTEPVSGDGFRYWIEQSRGAPRIARFALFRRPPLPLAPSVRRTPKGSVVLDGGGLPVRYTTDGSPVTAASPLYEAPFALAEGGTVRARTFARDDTAGLTLETAGEAHETFGLAPADFRIVGCSSEQGGSEAAAKAIDGDPTTHWHSRWSPDEPKPPHHLTLDLGRDRDLTGFVYTARHEGDNGTIADYVFEGSADGETWRELARGTFDREGKGRSAVVRFAAPQGARFVRLTALRELHGRPWASCAELSVLVR